VYGSDVLLYHRYIRRGVVERWHLLGVWKDVESALDSIDPGAAPQHPLLILRCREDEESAGRDSEIRAYEAGIEAESAARREHDARSAAAFKKLHSGSDAGRELCDKWTSITRFMATVSDLIKSLYSDPIFRPIYDQMMNADTVPTKRKHLRSVIDWLMLNKGITFDLSGNVLIRKQVRLGK